MRYKAMKYIVDIPDNHEANNYELVMCYKKVLRIDPCDFSWKSIVVKEIEESKIEKMGVSFDEEAIKDAFWHAIFNMGYLSGCKALNLYTIDEGLLHKKFNKLTSDYIINHINSFMKDAEPGDEVKSISNGTKYVVTKVCDDYYYGFDDHGVPVKIDKDGVVKTGFHLDVSGYIGCSINE